MSLSLDTELRERLIGRRGQWPKIAAAAEVSHSWLSQFARDKIPNPGFGTLKKLSDAMDSLPELAEPAPSETAQAAQEAG